MLEGVALARSKLFVARIRAQFQITVDEQDVDLLAGAWSLQVTFGQAQAVRKLPRGRIERLHMIVGRRVSPPPTDKHTIVEALNGNKLDCRRANLEWRTKADTNYRRALARGAPVPPVPADGVVIKGASP